MATSSKSTLLSMAAWLADLQRLVAHTPKPPSPLRLKLLVPPAAFPHSSANAYFVAWLRLSPIAERNLPAPSCREAGKPIKLARTEVDRAIFIFNVAAEDATRIYGEYLPLDWQEFTAGRWGIVKRYPLGPIAAITPFNFPLHLVSHKVAPAIAAGCSMVLKPAPQTPLSSLLLAECVCQQASVEPDGGLNVLPLSNDDASLLVTDERIKLISFTGSVPVGWDIKRRAGKKKVALELGGNAGAIVHSDADLAYAAERCVTGSFAYAGQTCISVQRILVEQSVYGKFTDYLVDGVKKLTTGDPAEESTDVGPLIRREH